MAPDRPSPGFEDPSGAAEPARDADERLPSTPPIDPFRQTQTLKRQPTPTGLQRSSGFYKNTDSAKSGRYTASDLPTESLFPEARGRASSWPVDGPPSSRRVPSALNHGVGRDTSPLSGRPSGGANAQADGTRADNAQADKDSAPPSGRSAPRRQRLPSQGDLKPLVIPGPVRERAADWLRTGELHLSRAVAAREARAWQRVMLLALMEIPGPRGLPKDLAQRASWLFRDGWDRNPLEVDDCLMLLRLPNQTRLRLELIEFARIATQQLYGPPYPR